MLDSAQSGTDVDRPTRNYDRFFSRVLPLFGVMLALTALTIGALIETDTLTTHQPIVFVGVFLLQLAIIFGARAYRDAYPANIALAVVFAIAEGVIATPMLNRFLETGPTGIITKALLATSLVFIGCAAYPIVSGKSFQKYGPKLFIALLGLLVVLIIKALVGFNGLLDLAINLASIALFSAFILYDVSSILENDNPGIVSGAISLYLDFILIFFNTLEILYDYA